MTERAISGMQVPASTAGQQAAAALTTRTVPKKLHPGVVQSVSGSRAMVLIGTEVKAAQISPTAKAVVPLDAVSLEKRAGTWWVVAVDTWHEPPKAVAPPTGSVPAASTVSGQTVNELAVNPKPPVSNVGSTLESVITWGINTRAHLLYLEAWLLSVRTQVNRLRANDISARGGINSNASATNSAASMLTSTRDATSALREGAIQDRVVKP